MDEVSIKLNVDELVARLNRMSANTTSLPMDAFAALVIGEIDDVFQSQGASGSDGEWAPFSPETLRRHPRRVGGMLLQDTGAMANVQVIEVTDQTFTIRSPTRYSSFHVTGTRDMPKRNFFALNFPDVLEQLAELVVQEVRR